MPSSKGEPDNPKLREQVKEEVKNLEKGGGKGSWSAWKAGELAKRYEAKGGGYLDKGDHKNKSKPGVPEKKEKDSSSNKKKEDKKEKDDDDGENDGGEKEDKDEDDGKKKTTAKKGGKGSSAGGKKK